MQIVIVGSKLCVVNSMSWSTKRHHRIGFIVRHGIFGLDKLFSVGVQGRCFFYVFLYGLWLCLFGNVFLQIIEDV